MPADGASRRRRTIAIVALIGALVGFTGALVNGDWVIGAAFAIVALAAAAMALRAGR